MKSLFEIGLNSSANVNETKLCKPKKSFWLASLNLQLVVNVRRFLRRARVQVLNLQRKWSLMTVQCRHHYWISENYHTRSDKSISSLSWKICVHWYAISLV